ncbi:ADP-ribosylglycohydrolase family protein [Brachyspira hampsonii]|uniref:ADP-ribosylglycohydrolase family protein n=1 Tax=Brachyspira hampsonii TaxID=1287055 RepID=UPI000AC535C4|nr:ADP-ribosylglycohydrolase family protein [Brachyspira hampsonii]
MYDEYSNGNGSLMRILPIAFYIKKYFDCELFENSEVIEIIYNVSSLTHSHKRSLIACVIYTSIALNLINDMSIEEAISKGLKDSYNYYKNEKELDYYKRIFDADFKKLYEKEIKSSGYVVHTLEASIWILLNTLNYNDAVLKAVNLGDDTDTTAAVTGGLAGLYYGMDNMPSKWIYALINKELIMNICSKFFE